MRCQSLILITFNEWSSAQMYGSVRHSHTGQKHSQLTARFPLKCHTIIKSFTLWYLILQKSANGIHQFLFRSKRDSFCCFYFFSLWPNVKIHNFTNSGCDQKYMAFTLEARNFYLCFRLNFDEKNALPIKPDGKCFRFVYYFLCIKAISKHKQNSV